MSDYATVIGVRKARRKDSFDPQLLDDLGTKHDISVISHRKRKEIEHTAMGEPGGNRAHPQRIRNGAVRQSLIDAND